MLLAVTMASAAGADAETRLAAAAEIRAGADAQAASEQRGIITELRAMRERNHLADMILDSIKRGGQP